MEQIRMVVQAGDKRVAGPFVPVSDEPNRMWHARQRAVRAFWTARGREKVWAAFGAFESLDGTVYAAADYGPGAVDPEPVETAPDPTRPIPGKVRAGQPETARDAARSVKLTAGSDRLMILRLLACSEGYTADRLSTLLGAAGRHVVANHVATRLSELAEDGLAVRTERVEVTRRGRKARVWEITDAGRSAARVVAR